MLTFDEVYKIIDKNSHETAFSRDEAFAYYNLLMELPNYSHVVEIGIEYGRSTMVAALIAKEVGFNLTSIDNWSGEYGKQAFEHVKNWKNEYNLDFNVWTANSSICYSEYHYPIELLFIDGDHSYKGVKDDCHNWIPKVTHNGLVLFHDYGRDSLPDVYRAVNDYINISTRKLSLIDHVYTLGVFRVE